MTVYRCDLNGIPKGSDDPVYLAPLYIFQVRASETAAFAGGGVKGMAGDSERVI